MKEPHNRAKVGYAMIVVSASLTAVALIALAIGGDVLYADNMQRESTAHFNECKESDFSTEDCLKYCDRINTKISGVFTDSCD